MKLSVKDLSALRGAAEVCELCGQGFTSTNPAVVDHDHATGIVRGVLHRGCNAALGTIENGRARYFLKDNVKLMTMLTNVVGYINKRRPDAPIYPTHKDADAKRILRNKRAAKARAAIRAAKSGR